MADDWRVVFESPSYTACRDRALVLTAAGLPSQIVNDAGACILVVPAEHSARAAEELRLYDSENPPPRTAPAPQLTLHDPKPGLFAYVVVVCAVALMAGYGVFGADWYRAGRVDGELIRGGELWRTITALSLHGGPPHLIGNLMFGVLYGLFAGRLLGAGVAWFTIVVTAAVGNLANTLLLESAHRSIGASTAVFAALGLVAGFVWRGKLLAQDRWPYRWGPVVGGFALLMFTGTGSLEERTDTGAHLMGFLAGFGGGLLLVPFMARLASRRLQLAAGLAAAGLVAGAWILALSA